MQTVLFMPKFQLQEYKSHHLAFSSFYGCIEAFKFKFKRKTLDSVERIVELNYRSTLNRYYSCSIQYTMTRTFEIGFDWLERT